MSMKKDNKTVGIMVRFFTNGLPDRVGDKKEHVPFWTSGNVHLEANKTKGVKPQNEIFHYIDDIPRAIKEVMRRANLAAVSDVGYSLRAEKRNKKRSTE